MLSLQKMICDLIIALEMACPGYVKEIVCVLARKASESVVWLLAVVVAVFYLLEFVGEQPWVAYYLCKLFEV